MFAMAAAITDVEALEELVQPAKIAAQGFRAPKQVRVVSSNDHSGDEAYYVYLIFPDETTDTALGWNKVKTMARWVQEEIWAANKWQRWPYIQIKRESELPDNLS
ncbi:MAG TPA: hypothetical protein VHH73_19975 [Verrucomicrobiae bacterium]|nr:hypothetical protein [Verrucomicrobiae bacterium]